MRAAAAVAAVLVLAGCGGARSGRGGPPPTSAETTFVRSCGDCHALAAAGTHGSAGGDLDRLRPSAAAVLRAIRTGPGAMPRDLVGGDEARLVANYVARSVRR
ncbi:MAG TPA: cytochrome c [Gaiellaceae bacterium]|nr:cytochrome c [Gaiellaceae bacterium]